MRLPFFCGSILGTCGPTCQRTQIRECSPRYVGNALNVVAWGLAPELRLKPEPRIHGKPGRNRGDGELPDHPQDQKGGRIVVPVHGTHQRGNIVCINHRSSFADVRLCLIRDYKCREMPQSVQFRRRR